MELYERIFELALNRSFFLPSNEPYGATGGFYDYGPVGKLMKNKIENTWRQMFIRDEGFLEVETSIITPEPILAASGHAANFADPVVECRVCRTRMRGDTLIEEKMKEKSGEMHGAKWDGKLESIDQIVIENGIVCPKCKGELGHATMFNLMFKTSIGGEQTTAFARPETAQGIFTAFQRIFRNHGAKLPLAVAQVGKSFRNEISPRKGLVRMREFTQMELEYFFNPASSGFEDFDKIKDAKLMMRIADKPEQMTAQELVEKKFAANQIMAYFLVRQWDYYKKVGVDEKKMHLRVLDSQEIPHYSKANIDMEVDTSFGMIETIGNAYRTDFDLTQHSKHSGSDYSVFIESEKKKVMPHVFELSMGVDRLFYCILEHCFREKDEKDETGNWKLGTMKPSASSPLDAAHPGAGKDWEWFDFPPVIAPYPVAVFPLMKKDGLSEKAQGVCQILRAEFDVIYQESGSIGKRYARADEIGCPYALTIDYDTLKDNTMTIRYRNDGKQERIKIEECVARIKQNIEKGRVTL